MTSAQVVETSVTDNSSFQNYPHQDDEQDELLVLIYIVCELDFSNVIRFADDVAALLKMLVLFDHEEQAALLQTNFQQLITTIETSINIIWPPEETSDNVNHVSQVCEAQ